MGKASDPLPDADSAQFVQMEFLGPIGFAKKKKEYRRIFMEQG